MNTSRIPPLVPTAVVGLGGGLLGTGIGAILTANIPSATIGGAAMGAGCATCAIAGLGIHAYHYNRQRHHMVEHLVRGNDGGDDLFRTATYMPQEMYSRELARRMAQQRRVVNSEPAGPPPGYIPVQRRHPEPAGPPPPPSSSRYVPSMPPPGLPPGYVQPHAAPPIEPTGPIPQRIYGQSFHTRSHRDWVTGRSV